MVKPSKKHRKEDLNIIPHASGLDEKVLEMCDCNCNTLTATATARGSSCYLLSSNLMHPGRNVPAGDLPLREGGSSPSCRVSKAWYRLSVSWPMRGREFVVGCVGSERGLLVVGELGPDHFTTSSVTFRQLRLPLHNMLWYSNSLTHLRRSTDCWFREADARSGRL